MRSKCGIDLIGIKLFIDIKFSDRKQKNMSRIKKHCKKNKSSSTVESNIIPSNNEDTINKYICNYGMQIQPQPWLIHQQIDMYGVCTRYQLQGLCSMDITQEQFKQLIEKQLKLCALLDPIMQALQQHQEQLKINKMKQTCKQMSLPMESFLKIIKSLSSYESSDAPQKIDLKILLKILQKQQFLRFLTKNCRYRMLINNRSTDLNTKIIISAVILFKLKKLKFKQISQGVLLFNLQQSYTNNAPFGISSHSKQIFQVLIKLNRSYSPQKVLKFIAQSEQSNNPQKPKMRFLSLDKFLCLLSLTTENKKKNSIFQYKKVNGKIIFKNNLFSKGKFRDIFDNQQENKQEQANQEFVIQGIPFFTQDNEKANKNEQCYKAIKRCLSLKQRPKTSLLQSEIQKMQKINRRNKVHSQYNVIPPRKLRQIQSNIQAHQQKYTQKASLNMPSRYNSAKSSPKYFQPWLSCTSNLKIQSILKSTYQIKKSQKIRKIYKQQLMKYSFKQKNC